MMNNFKNGFGFGRNSSSSEPVKIEGRGQKREQDWESLIADLEDDLEDCDNSQRAVSDTDSEETPKLQDDGSDNPPLSELDETSPDWRGISSDEDACGVSDFSFNGNSSGVKTGLLFPAASSRSSLQPLKDWIAVNASKNQRDISQIGKKIDKDYLEKAARLALSLAVKLDSHTRPDSTTIVLDCDITISNIHVTGVSSDEADFINVTNVMGDGSEDNGITDRSIHENTGQSKRLAIHNLGHVFAELFSQGTSLKHRSNSAKLSATASNGRASFGRSLKISNDGGGDDIFFTQKQRRRFGEEKEQSISTLLQLEGLPSSLCRLISEMIGNNEDDNDLFRHDNAISSFADVVSDLQEMVENPTSFLHDSLLLRWKPVVKEKLYGRDIELRQSLAVAERVHQFGEDPFEDQFSHACFGAQKKTEVLILSGHSGSGKSTLGREVGARLEESGWHTLYCKFDRAIHFQPLSPLTSAFDQYFANLLSQSTDVESREDIHEIKRKILSSFDEENMGILLHLIPNMKTFLSIVDSYEVQHVVDNFHLGDIMASQACLHHLFVLLMKAISFNGHPILLFLDDLQWADTASLELIISVMQGVGCEVHNGSDGEKSGYFPVLFLGSYRSNEVADSDLLNVGLQHLKSREDICLTEVALQDISCNSTNLMISEALCYPRRLTKPLSKIISEKTQGNPFYIKELLNDLIAENLLNYNLSSRKWEWDEDLIQGKTVSDGVAELLTRKLCRLPKDVLLALKVMSCFGSKVSPHVLALIDGICGNTNIRGSLDCAIEEGLVQKSNESLSFVHDMILESVQRDIDPDTQFSMLREIAETLLAKTKDEREDLILFIVVDLINRVGPERTPKDDDRLRNAELNLVAGKKAVQTPDFASAVTYLESGIAFLSEDHWIHHYALSLELFQNVAFAQWSQGNTDVMNSRLQSIFDNAKCFEDKIDSFQVLIVSLGMDGSSVAKSFEHGFVVLGHLGETFPSTPDNETIVRELIETKNMLHQFMQNSLHDFPVMQDKKKMDALNFLAIMLTQSYQQKSRFSTLIACRVVRLSINHGIGRYSAVGIASLALCYVTVFNDVSEGYKIGKIALELVNSTKCSKDIPEVHGVLFGLVNFWKEPIQALLPSLMNTSKMAMNAGRIDCGLSSLMFYSYRAFFSGSNLLSLNRDVPVFIRQMSLYKRTIFGMGLVPILDTVKSLAINSCHNQSCENDDQNLANAFNQKELNVAETIVIMKMMKSVIFLDFDVGKDIAKRYLTLFESHDKALRQFINIYRNFYGGLISFHCFRKTQDEFWKERGLYSIRKMEEWNKDCEWNFLNKLRTLEAEYYFSVGEFEKAETAYNEAVTKARDHRFVHEEAIASELASTFHTEMGGKELKNEFLMRAVECYRKWGAQEKVKALLQSVQSN